MYNSNFHMHCRFCDGKGEPEEYVLKAISLGFPSIGFSSHAPLPFEAVWTMKESKVEEYCETLRGLREKYKGQIEIYLGMEIDYLPGINGPALQKFKDLGLDYTIGSVHCMESGKPGEYLTIDGSVVNFERVLNEVFKGDIQEMVRDYYKRIRDMVSIHNPSIIGHFDIIKKNNINSSYFSEDEDWYRAEILETLNFLSGTGVIIEVNTGGIARKYIDDIYPTEWILRECKKLNIPIMLNSDAHTPDDIAAYYEEAIGILKEIGFTKQHIMLNRSWQTVDL